jgi:hypothetical protein
MYTTDTDTLTAYVKAGAVHADAHWDTWWWTVDPGWLDMSDATTCVLGQLFWSTVVDEGHYVDVPMWTDLAAYVFPGTDQPCDHASDLGFDGYAADHDQLTELWRAEIRSRREAA